MVDSSVGALTLNVDMASTLNPNKKALEVQAVQIFTI
jgi:hypothetical protein